MNTNDIVDALDSEISRLRQVRDLLSEKGTTSGFAVERTSSSRVQAKKRGRPPGSKNFTASVANDQVPSVRKGLSPEAKERIAVAQRKRWAKHKAAVKKAARDVTKAAYEKASSPRASQSSTKKKGLAGSKTSGPKPVKKTSAAKDVIFRAAAAKKSLPVKNSITVKRSTIANKTASSSTRKSTGSTRSTSPKTSPSPPTKEQPLPSTPAPTSSVNSTSNGPEPTAE